MKTTPDTSSVIIRLAREDDFPAWQQMRHELWSYHTAEELLQEFLQIQAEIPDYVAFMAFVGDMPVGFVELQPHAQVMGTLSPAMYVEGIYVREAYRRCGIAGMLVERAKQHAVSLGLKYIASDTRPNNTTSITAHEQLGFHNEGHLVHFLMKV